METSQIFESCQFAVPSPCGSYIASLTQQHLYVQWANSLAPAYTFPLEGFGPKSIAETSTIRWSPATTFLALLSAHGVHVFSLNDPSLKVQVSNGSGSLGKISAVDVLGEAGREQLLVVWEFGRVMTWDLSAGRASELGDVKTGGKSPLWAVRRVKAKTEVLAVVSRIGAQDVLSLFISPDPSPFRAVTLPTSDAQSLSWSQCGRWLSILDTPLASPSLYIYTADGHAFRKYPPAGPSTPPTTPDDNETTPFELGSKSLTWSPTAVALLSHQNALNILSTKMFPQVGIINAEASADTSGYQESVTATGVRSYAFLSGNSLPQVSSKSSLCDIRFNVTGSYLTARDEAAPSNLIIWDVEAKVVKCILTQYNGIRKLSWHPQHPDILLLVSEDGSIHLWDVNSGCSPIHLTHAYSNRKDINKVDALWIAPSRPSVSSIVSPESKISLLITTRKAGWTVVWPNGRDEHEPAPESHTIPAGEEQGEDEAEGDATEDSLYDILTGRTPLPELKASMDPDDHAIAYVGAGGDSDAGEDTVVDIDESTTRLDDTFREKRLQKVEFEDDSEIF